MVRLVIVMLLSCCVLVVQAAQTMDAYRIETQVDDQSEAQRIAAVKTGMSEVIVRVSGEAALQHPLVRQALGSASDYLLQFSYGADREQASESVRLSLSYSAQAIESLLRQAQLPLGADTAKGASALMVRVDKVADFSAFKQVAAYLETIAIIRRSELVSVNKDFLIFRLTLEGDSELLKNSLALDNRLQLDESVAAEPQTQCCQLAFHWQN